jgi:hypothetical protein
MSNIRSVEMGFCVIASAPETSVDADWAFVLQSRSPLLSAPAVSGDSCHELLRD